MALHKTYDPAFERFWSEYPVKVNKGAAFKAWEKLKLSPEDVDELVLHIHRRKKDDAKWLEGKFIPHAASFLNGHRWEDVYQRAKKPEAIDRDWSGHQPSDDENNRKYWQAAARRGLEVPEQYRHYVEMH
jgi:hypothetical protein